MLFTLCDVGIYTNLTNITGFIALVAFTVIVAGVVTFCCRHSNRQKMLHYIASKIPRRLVVPKEQPADEQTSMDDEAEQDEQPDEPRGLVSKFKAAQLRKLEANLTEDQLEEERRIEREQLAIIFEMLKKQEAALNVHEIDESELNAQLNLYR